MQNLQTTRDFYLAAFLVAKGINLESHNKSNGSTLFNFPGDTNTQETIEQFYSMKARVEPLAYANSIKTLKSILHSYNIKNANAKFEVNNHVKQYKGNQ